MNRTWFITLKSPRLKGTPEQAPNLFGHFAWPEMQNAVDMLGPPESCLWVEWHTQAPCGRGVQCVWLVTEIS